MERKSSVTLKLIVSFFLISFILFISAYLYVVLVKVKWAGEVINYNKVGLIAALLLHIKAIPAILIVSLHMAFSEYIDVKSTKTSSLLMKPLIFSLFIIMTYASYSIYFLSQIYNQIDIELSKIEYIKLIDYRAKLKNEALENARESLKKNNIDIAYMYLSDAKFYSPSDNEINLILKNINHSRVEKDEDIERYNVLNINKYLDTAVMAYTKKQYKEAYRLFINILKIEPHNKLAIYYMNRINEVDKSLSTYKGNDKESIYIYDKLSDSIMEYENGNIWNAYNKIDILYKMKPSDIEVKSYYDLIISNVRKYDFFIEDAEKIRGMYIEKKINDSLGSKNGFNILIADNNILNVSSALYYGDDFYMFDISQIELGENANNAITTRYKYGKLLDTSDNENKNRKTFILKAKYNNANNTYSTNNRISYTNISVQMSDDTLYNIRTKKYIKPDFASIYGLHKLRTELPPLGYNLYKIDNEMIKKVLDIFYLIAISTVVIYYSLKYRTQRNKRKHVFHFLIGVFGILFILLLIQIEFLKIVDYLVTLINTNLIITLMLLPSSAITIRYLNKLFKIKKDV